MKDTLRRLFLSTLEELALERHMPRKVVCRESVLGIGNDRIELAPFKKVLAVAIGKAAFPMAQEMSRILRPQVLSGIAVSSVPPPDTLPYFVAYQGGHPPIPMDRVCMRPTWFWSFWTTSSPTIW